MDNTLFYGDNLDILRRYIKDETVDLVYLDPPFNSNATYNVLFGDQKGERSAAQIQAFDDTWHWDTAAAEAFDDVLQYGGRPAEAMQAFETLLGHNDMLAYLSMMAPRLIELRRVLKPTGSIYLHCDPTASHYLKVLMDAVFGANNILNEIVWYYRGAGVPKQARARRHDVILWYAKREGHHYFDPDPIRQPYADATVERFKHHIGNVRGDHDYGVQALHPAGKHPDDVITHIQPIAPSAKARLGYPTQKPDELLEDIIASSSREGDLVLDPFCGCGTAIVAAQKLDRRWVGIDITHLAVNLMRYRLRDTFGAEVTFSVVGEPTARQDAEELARTDPYQFQFWALGLVGARPAEQKKGADKGIDGRLYFRDDPKAPARQVIISVKAGILHRNMVHELRGVVEREKAAIGVLISMNEATRPMREEAASAGFYDSTWGTRHPRIQLLTVDELLHGKRIDYPVPAMSNVTLRQAPRAREDHGRQGELFGGE